MSQVINGLTGVAGNCRFACPDGAATYNIATSSAFSVAGIAETRGATSNRTLTLDPAGLPFKDLAQNEGCVFVVCVDIGNNPSVHQSVVSKTDASGNFVFAPDFPEIDTSVYCPFGFMVVTNTGSADFVPGTTFWNATGVTTVAKAVTSLPQRPQYK